MTDTQEIDVLPDSAIALESNIYVTSEWPVTECRCIYGMGGRCVHCDPRLAEQPA